MKLTTALAVLALLVAVSNVIAVHPCVRTLSSSSSEEDFTNCIKEISVADDSDNSFVVFARMVGRNLFDRFSVSALRLIFQSKAGKKHFLFYIDKFVAENVQNAIDNQDGIVEEIINYTKRGKPVSFDHYEWVPEHFLTRAKNITSLFIHFKATHTGETQKFLSMFTPEQLLLVTQKPEFHNGELTPAALNAFLDMSGKRRKYLLKAIESFKMNFISSLYITAQGSSAIELEEKVARHAPCFFLKELDFVPHPDDLSYFTDIPRPKPSETSTDHSHLLSRRMSDLSQALKSNDLGFLLRILKELRRILSQNHKPFLSIVDRFGLVPRLKQIMEGDELSQSTDRKTVQMLAKLQLEACWILTKFANCSLQHTAHVVESGAVRSFVQLLDHSRPEIRDQCILALGNITGKSCEFRDVALNSYAIIPLLNILKNEMANGFSNGDLALNTTRVIKSLCRCEQAVSWEQVSLALPILIKLLNVNNEGILEEASWTIVNMTNISTKATNDIYASGIAPRLLALLKSGNVVVQASCLTILQMFIEVDSTWIQNSIDSGELRSISRLLSSSCQAIVKKVCEIISDIAASSEQLAKAVVKENLVNDIIPFLSSNEMKIRLLASRIIRNVSSFRHSSPEIIKDLAMKGVIQLLCKNLSFECSSLILICLKSLKYFLQVGQKESLFTKDHTNPYALIIEEAEGVDMIYHLKRDKNSRIASKSRRIIKQFFLKK